MAEQTPQNRHGSTRPQGESPHPMDDLDGGGHSPHAPADDKEVIYYEGSPLLRGDLSKFVICAILAGLLIGIPLAIRILKPDVQIPWWVWLVVSVLAVVLLIIPFLLVKAIRYRVSNYRIDYERGLLGKKIDTLELWHVEDIQFNQSVFGRIFNVGTVTVISHDDTTPELQLEGLPNPRQIFESLKQRVIAVKRQRGVVKMDIG